MTKGPSSAPGAVCIQPFDIQLPHLVDMAKKPESKAHACWRALELEADKSGLWPGIVKALQAQVPGLEKTIASVALEFKKRH